MLKSSNPDWTRDELIVALDAYLTHRLKIPNKNSPDIRALSEAIKNLGQTVLGLTEISETFRNVNGVYMKLMNFRSVDPQFTARGRKGLSAGNKAEKEVWKEFANDPKKCKEIANAILEGVKFSEIMHMNGNKVFESDFVEAIEGRILSHLHVRKERNSKLRTNKFNQAIDTTGKLACEVCGFDFSVYYGQRGEGFIECHHKKPLSSLEGEQKTHIDDLALVCANCHRMIHRSKNWLSIEELKYIISQSSQKN